MKITYWKPFLFGLTVVLLSCQSEPTSSGGETVKVRLIEEPDHLHPMISKSAGATQLENHIFLPLMEFNPEKLELQPLLVERLPQIDSFRNGKKFTFEINENARWHDGQPVTAKDYLFTVKAAVNPHTKSRSWRGFLSEIDSVSIDSEDARSFTVYIDDAFHLALETAANFNIYPAHHYDPEGLLENYSLTELKQDSIGGKAAEFGERFNSTTWSRDSILGSGPYKLKSWQPNLLVELEKWDDFALPLPKAEPKLLQYYVVPDEATAISMLRGGQLDVISSVSPTVFNDLQKEENTEFAFHAPSVMQYYYLALNNRSEILGSFEVRRALAHLLDLEKLSEVLMAGLAQPVAGPVHPQKPHFNNSLEIIRYDTTEAKKQLAADGWSDSDEDGFLDKTVNGELIPLQLEILVTQRELGRNLARIFKENARQVGVDIVITSLEWAQIVQKMASRDFDIIAMATRQSPGLDDFYGSWHTASIGPDGRNIAGFGDEVSDQMILDIRNELNTEKRNVLYKEFQQLIYDRQPLIFLFAPTETIIHRSSLNMAISSRRPGYFENTAVQK